MELNFKDFLNNSNSDNYVVNMYFHNHNITIHEIASKANKSIGEVYRILHKYGTPNRQKTTHHIVHSFANSGFGTKAIAELTKMTPRNVRYILKGKN